MHMSMKSKWTYLALLALFPMLAAGQCKQTDSTQNKATMDSSQNYKVSKTEEEWKAQLTPDEYRVLRQKGTERPFSSEYETLWDSGTYVCKACGAELFKSDTKFDAHCGWPSFYQSIDKSAVREILDTSHGMVRTEVVCANCGGHLGHVFNDGHDQPTGLRYCINGVSLGFKKK
jgi:peptide-methionine (R)-S-oxide reductase